MRKITRTILDIAFGAMLIWGIIGLIGNLYLLIFL